MALGIEIGNTLTKVGIPVRSYNDPEMNDNTWIVEHLRELASYIESKNPKIYKVGTETSTQYGASFYIEHFNQHN